MDVNDCQHCLSVSNTQVNGETKELAICQLVTNYVGWGVSQSVEICQACQNSEDVPETVYDSEPVKRVCCRAFECRIRNFRQSEMFNDVSVEEAVQRRTHLVGIGDSELMKRAILESVRRGMPKDQAKRIAVEAGLA